MTNNKANKSIKDLKELNEKLKNQKFQAEAREWTLNRRNQELKEQIEMLVKDDEKSQETIIELSNRIDKARNYFEDKYFDFHDERYKRMIEILDGEEGETSAR